MSYNPNQEVLKQIKESKGPGEYMTTNFTPMNGHGVFNSSVGYGNSYSGHVSKLNVDSDSFLKNLHIRNSKSIVYNPIKEEINFKPNFISTIPSSTDTRVKKIQNDTFGILSYQQNVNQVLPNKVNYKIGMDSRHENR